MRDKERKNLFCWVRGRVRKVWEEGGKSFGGSNYVWVILRMRYMGVRVVGSLF